MFLKAEFADNVKEEKWIGTSNKAHSFDNVVSFLNGAKLLVDPVIWDANDDQAALALGFTPAAIAATKEKGRYLDQRLAFSPDGVWRAFDIGGS